MDSLGTRRTVVPLLVHEDCIGDIKTDLAEQQEILSKIKVNTGEAAGSLFGIENGSLPGIRNLVDEIALHTNSIKTSSSNTATQLGTIKTDTTTLTSSVGTTTDTSTSNTVIGLLKSISNKLS